MGLNRLTDGNGGTPFTGWLMLREMRRFAPRDPKYPTIAERSRAICRCTLTFHDRIDAFSNHGSIVTGARRTGCVAVTAARGEIEPVAVNGVANGGLPVVSRTAVVLGWSAADPYAARITVRPSPDGVHA